MARGAWARDAASLLASEIKGLERSSARAQPKSGRAWFMDRAADLDVNLAPIAQSSRLPRARARAPRESGCWGRTCRRCWWTDAARAESPWRHHAARRERGGGARAGRACRRAARALARERLLLASARAASTSWRTRTRTWWRWKRCWETWRYASDVRRSVPRCAECGGVSAVS